MSDESGPRSPNDEWQLSWLLFIGGLSIGLLFLFAARAPSVFCDTTDTHVESVASCVRSWIGALGPWVAIVAAVASLRPLVGQWQQMHRQNLMVLREPLLDKLKQLFTLSDLIDNAIYDLESSGNAGIEPRNQYEILLGRDKILKNRRTSIRATNEKILSIDSNNHHLSRIASTLEHVKEQLSHASQRVDSAQDQAALLSIVNQSVSGLSHLKTVVMREITITDGHLDAIDVSIGLRQSRSGK